MIVLGALAIGVLCIIAFAKINKQIKNEKNLAYTNATPAMGQPGNPYVNPVTGQPYDAGVVNPVTGQAYNQTPDAGYGQAPNQTYNQTPDGAPSVPYTPGQTTIRIHNRHYYRRNTQKYQKDTESGRQYQRIEKNTKK